MNIEPPNVRPAHGWPAHLAILGWPVAHSLSPAMHNAALRALGLPWRYELLPVPPAALKTALTAWRQHGFIGANVTIPHKQAILPLLDGVTPRAGAIGAVNTLFWQPGRMSGKGERDGDAAAPRLLGDNTDGPGFLADLCDHGVVVTGQRALVMGAGGAARAVIYSLLEAGAAVTILNRTLTHAQALAADMRIALPGAQVACAGFGSDLAVLAAQADLVVNTTSVGMTPASDAMPWDAAVPFEPRQVVTDLVYRPRRTALLRKAQADGAQTLDGVGMLVAQGALALARWTGQPAPLTVMRAAVEEALAED